MGMIAQYVHKAIEAATPWLVGTAVGFFLLWLAMLIREKKPFAKELKWFSGLAPLHKFIVVCAVCFFTLWGGSKERGILPSGLIDDISSTVSRVVETIQLRTLPENVASNAFAVTDFAVDSQGKETAFGLEWASNLFENVDSRNIDLFMSTHLAVNGWFVFGRYLMPLSRGRCGVDGDSTAGMRMLAVNPRRCIIPPLKQMRWRRTAPSRTALCSAMAGHQ